jgi:WD40 repeat protein
MLNMKKLMFILALIPSISTINFHPAVHAQNDGPVTSLDWSSKGKLAIGYAGKLELLDQQGNLIRKLDDLSIQVVAWSPDGSRLAYALSGERADNLWILDEENADPKSLSEVNGTVHDIGWNGDGSKLVAVTQLSIGPGAHNYIEVWDTTTLEQITNFEVPLADFFMYGVDWNPTNDNDVVTASYGGNVYVWDIEKQAYTTSFSVADDSCFWILDPNADTSMIDRPVCDTDKAAWSPDGKMLAATSTQGVWIWDTSTWESRILNLDNMTTSLAWSLDGRLAALSFQTISIFEPTTGEILITIQSPIYIHAIAWSPDGTKIAYGGESGELHIVDVPQAEATPEPP